MASDETGAPVEVEVQVLDVADVAEGVVQVVLGRLLVQVGHKDDPALDGCGAPSKGTNTCGVSSSSSWR